MAKIVIFGAGGRAGRRAVAEAARRGHRVTAVVRDPSAHPDLAGAVAGDITDAAAVGAIVAGHDAVIHAAVDLTNGEFFTAASRALVEGLGKAGVRRVVAVGLASVMPGPSGGLMMDEPGYPNEYRSFYLAHAAGLDVLKESGLDWTYVAPAGDFDHEGERGGAYAVAAHGDAADRITYPDFAIALIDEVENGAHTRAAFIVRAHRQS
ncbi:NAD(P)H-binding protein [Actinomadura barringtoniae]|uniref:NAD(P)H-binding protein n=1 Tax=Actinomadura barringtoniae TaxID=1427535 RepID=A0A939TA62_9ACTN|nr:NAD(P)H-binding protein [Actinomadura barringtoniae]MBO2452137.1 NAD(P)H-binding protein [Actinomadura barringtoniae]